MATKTISLLTIIQAIQIAAQTQILLTIKAFLLTVMTLNTYQHQKTKIIATVKMKLGAKLKQTLQMKLITLVLQKEAIKTIAKTPLTTQ